MKVYDFEPGSVGRKAFFRVFARGNHQDSIAICGSLENANLIIKGLKLLEANPKKDLEEEVECLKEEVENLKEEKVGYESENEELKKEVEKLKEEVEDFFHSF